MATKKKPPKLQKPPKPRKATQFPPIVIADVEYFTIRQFARITGRFESYISKLFSEGNKIRKLKGIKIGGRPLIQASEIDDFPFTTRSNNGKPIGPAQLERAAVQLEHMAPLESILDGEQSVSV